MLATEVFVPDPVRFDMTGQRVTQTLTKVEEGISAGLSQRLYAYAERELQEQGFGPLAVGATVTVYTISGDKKLSDRSYCVRWHTPKGGYVEMVGILTRSGWPCVDYGFAIGFEER